MKKTSKIISIILTVAMLMGLMTSVSFAAQTLPTTFGWSTENEGYITIDVPAFDGDEVYYELDLYKDGNLVSGIFGNYFDASGEQESDVFVEKINELGNGTYTYKIGLSRNSDTDELENCTGFSGEYVKTDSQQVSNLPTNLCWSSEKVGRLQITVPEHIEGNIRYGVTLYKDNNKVVSTTWSVWAYASQGTRVQTTGTFEDEIYENGNGRYTFTISYDSETTEHSEVFNYVKPSKSLQPPTDIVLTDKEVRWTPISDENCDGYWVDFYVGYPSREYFKVYGQEERGKESCSQNYVSDNDVATYSSQQIDRMYGIDPVKYSKDLAFLAVTVYARTNNISACNSSAPSGYVTVTEEENVFRFTLPDLSGSEGETIISENIYNSVPQSMQFGLMYASSEYDEYINNHAVLTFENSTGKKVYNLSNTPLKYVSTNNYKLEIPLDANLPAGTYQLTIELDIAEAKETTDVKPFVITIQNVEIKGKQTITFMVNGEIYTTNKQLAGEIIDFPELSLEGYWFRGWSVSENYIIPEKDITITADVVPLATIRGQVIGTDGEAAVTKRVFISTYKDYGDNGMVSVLTDGEGKFELIYPQGELLLNICLTANPYLSKEIVANQAVVDLGEIELSPVTSFVSAQKQVETVKGLNAVSETILTDEEKALVESGEKTIQIACSAGNVPVIDEESDIAKEIAKESSETTAIYYIDISMNKYVLDSMGNPETADHIYELPQLIEIVIDIPDDLIGKNKFIIYREHTTQTEDGTSTTIEKITTEANEFGEYLTVADGKINLFVKRFSTYAIVGIDNEEPEQPNESEQPTYRPTGGSGSSSTIVSVPTSTGTDVKATVSGTTATISKIDTSKVSEETSYAIDMSGVKKTVKSVKLPTSAVKDLAKETSTVETLDIKLSNGSVSFDADALKTISEDAKGSQITLNINDATTKLTANEKNTIKEISSPMVVEVSLLSNNKTISDFKGGKAIISVPYELKNGQIAESVVAQHIGENGVLTAMETSYDSETKTVSFATPHFSKYVISAVYEKDAIVLNIGKKDARVFGETITNDVAPKIVNERTMLPIRFIAEKLGASVDWVQESRTVIVELDDIKISLVIGENFAMVNNEKIELDSASFVEDGRTFLPIRFVMENLGADVLWNNNTQTVTITK